MQINRKLLTIVLASIIILGVGTTFAFAQTNTDKDWSSYKKNHESKFMSQLTEEQISILKETKIELKEQDASWEEIHEAMKELYDEWGIELPEWGDKSKYDFSGRHFLKGESFGEGCSYRKGLSE